MSEPSAILEVTRVRSVANLLRGYAVLIDGRKVDKIKAGETKRYGVPSGRHTIGVALDLYKTKPLTLDLAPGETLLLECGDKAPKTLGETFTLRGLGDALGSALSPSDYLYIRVFGRGPAAHSSPETADARLQAPPDLEQPRLDGARGEDPGPMIFLSYRRDDTEQITGRIRDRLTARFGERSIFRDVDSIPVGMRFRDKIEETLRAAKVLVAVIGPQWAEAVDRQGRRRMDQPEDPVRFELETALALGLPLLPILVKEARMPQADELPASLTGLPGINAVIIPAEPYFSEGMVRLNAAIESLTAPVRGIPSEAPKRFCTGCGNPLNPNQAFCTKCGRRV
jgi:TIR domain